MTRIHTETFFRNHIKSNRNQIVFTMHRLIWNSKRTFVWIQINRKMVNTIWFRIDLIGLTLLVVIFLETNQYTSMEMTIFNASFSPHTFVRKFRAENAAIICASASLLGLHRKTVVITTTAEPQIRNMHTIFYRI